MFSHLSSDTDTQLLSITSLVPCGQSCLVLEIEVRRIPLSPLMTLTDYICSGPQLWDTAGVGFRFLCYHTFVPVDYT